MKTRNDCTVRALSRVTELPYDVVVDRLRQDGYRPGHGFHLDRWLSCQMNPAIGDPELVFGWTAEWVKLPRVRKGETRPTIATFADADGRYIVRQSRHVVAVVEGVIATEERYPGAPVYGAWRFTRNGGRFVVVTSRDAFGSFLVVDTTTGRSVANYVFKSDAVRNADTLNTQSSGNGGRS